MSQQALKLERRKRKLRFKEAEMALFGETHKKHEKRMLPWGRIVQQALLVPEAGVLMGLLLIAWAFNFPPVIGILAIITAFAFGLRMGLLVLAEQQLTHGAYTRADRLSRAALRLNPWSADALVLRAQGLMHQGMDEAAEQLLRRAATMYPKDHVLQSALAAAILAQGRIAEGAQLARVGNITHIHSPQAAQQLAWLALHVEQDALKARTIVLDAEPTRLAPPVALPLLATLGEAQIVLGAHDEAERSLHVIETKLLACPQPQQAELLYHLGRLYEGLGRDGTSYFRRSVELDPDGRYAQAAWRSAVDSAA